MAKITKAEMPALAEQIVKCLGGKENVARINHCATRLRVNPVDMEKVDKDGLKRLHGVIGIDSSKAELQIIVGAIIEDLYLEVEKITGNGGGAVADDVPFWKKRPSEIFSSFLLLMAGCLSPVIPALIASGLLATVLTIMTLVLHVDASTSSTYSILYNLSQTVFYFMPVLVAYTSAKKSSAPSRFWPWFWPASCCTRTGWLVRTAPSPTISACRSCIPLIMAP